MNSYKANVDAARLALERAFRQESLRSEELRKNLEEAKLKITSTKAKQLKQKESFMKTKNSNTKKKRLYGENIFSFLVRAFADTKDGINWSRKAFYYQGSWASSEQADAKRKALAQAKRERKNQQRLVQWLACRNGQMS